MTFLDNGSIEFTLPSHWASFLVNGDRTCYLIADLETMQYWISKECLGSCLANSDYSFFSWTNDSNIPLGCDCMSFTFKSPVPH